MLNMTATQNKNIGVYYRHFLQLLVKTFITAKNIRFTKSHHPQSIAVDDGFTFIESYSFLERMSTPFPLEEA